MKKKPPASRHTHVKQPHEVVQDALLLAGRKEGPDEQLEAHSRIAKQLGVSASMLYKWGQPAERGSGSPNPLERTAQLLGQHYGVHVHNFTSSFSDGAMFCIIIVRYQVN